MRSCILIALACILIPAAALAESPWQRIHDNLNVAAAVPTFRIGPGYDVVGPTAALLRLLGPGHHVVGPTAALLWPGGGHHLVGPTAALCRRPSDGAGRRGIAK